MYNYTNEQLTSMKKVEASREKRLQNLFARMSADEKQKVLQENHPAKSEQMFVFFIKKMAEGT